MDSTPRKGTVFWFELRLPLAPAGALPPPRVAASARVSALAGLPKYTRAAASTP